MNIVPDTFLFQDIVVPALDVLLLSFLLYQGYQLLVQTRAVQLVRGALVIGFLYLIAFFLELTTLLWLINLLAPSLVIALVIIFQSELRKIFTRIGRGRFVQLGAQSYPEQVNAVISAVGKLSRLRRGALIVFPRSMGQKYVIETGTRLDARISSALLLTIFGYDTDLHDGAVVVEHESVVSAGCLLPLSDQTDIRHSFGTRHRAALGLAEETDAVVVVVSEESGAISLAYDSNLYYDITLDDMLYDLVRLLNIREAEKEVTRFAD